jgi:hypothetical protein
MALGCARTDACRFQAAQRAEAIHAKDDEFIAQQIQKVNDGYALWLALRCQRAMLHSLAGDGSDAS